MLFGSGMILPCTWGPAAGFMHFLHSFSGPGFSDEQLQKVFEPFYTTKGKGLGLGLTISQRIMASFSGTIAAANHPQGGAVFTLTLPIKREPEV